MSVKIREVLSSYLGSFKILLVEHGPFYEQDAEYHEGPCSFFREAEFSSVVCKRPHCIRVGFFILLHIDDVTVRTVTY